MGKPYQNESVLREKYCEEKQTVSGIAEEFGCSHGTILRWLGKHDIETRSRGGGVKYPRLWNEEWLRAKYIDEELSTQDIADIVGCSKSQAKRRVRESGIETRPSHPLPKDDRVHDNEWLHKQYVENDLSMAEISDKFDIPKTTLARALRRSDIEVHPRDASGEDHYCWSGGYDEYYGPNWNKQRKKRREKDDNKCVVCGVTNEEHKQKYGRTIEVHHIQKKETFRDEGGDIDYERANKINNLVTLCTPCHRKWEGIPVVANGNG